MTPPPAATAATAARDATAPATPGRIPARGLAAYLLVTFGVMAAVIAPFALTDASSLVLASLIPFVQWVPALAAVVAERVEPSGRPVRETLALRPPRGGLVRGAVTTTAVFAAVLAVHLAASLALGVSAWRPVDGAALSALMVLPVALGMMLTTTGEELGWRGWLTTALAPLGALRAALTIGAIWSLWHLPLLLVYADRGEMAGREVIVTGVNLVLGALVLSALRLRTGSVWPAALGHALMNSLLVFGYSSLIVPSRELATGDYWAFAAIGWACWVVAAAAVWTRRAQA